MKLRSTNSVLFISGLLLALLSSGLQTEALSQAPAQTKPANTNVAPKLDPTSPSSSLTVTVLPGTQSPQNLLLADLLTVALSQDARLAPVDRTQTDRILAEWKLTNKVGRIIAWDMLIRVTIVNPAQDKPEQEPKLKSVKLTCVDLSHGNIIADETLEFTDDEKVTAKLASIVHAAAEKQLKRSPRKSVRYLGMGDSGNRFRLLPLITKFDELIHEQIKKSDQWELVNHIEALTSKEESLLLYAGFARLDGQRKFTPVADATIEASLVEKDAIGKKFEETPVVAELKFILRGSEPKILKWESVVNDWETLAKKIEPDLKSLLKNKSSGSKLVTSPDAQSRRAAAKKAFDAARKARNAPATKTAGDAGQRQEKSIRENEYIEGMATALKLDPSFEPAAYDLARHLYWVDDVKWQARGLLETYRYIQRFPNKKIKHLLSIAETSNSSVVLFPGDAATKKQPNRWADVAWTETPKLHEVLKFLAELSLDRAIRSKQNNSRGALTLMAYSAMHEAGVSKPELQVWTKLQLEKARKIIHNVAAKPDQRSASWEIVRLIKVYYSAADAAYLAGDQKQALQIYREACVWLSLYYEDTFVWDGIMCENVGRRLGVKNPRSLYRVKAKVRPPAPPKLWVQPYVFPATAKIPSIPSKKLAVGWQPLLAYDGRLISRRYREDIKLDGPRKEYQPLLVTRISNDGVVVGKPEPVTIVDEKGVALYPDPLGIGGITRCGEKILVATKRGLLIGTLDDLRWRLVTAKDGLPLNEVSSVVADTERSVVIFLGRYGPKDKYLCRYDLIDDSTELLWENHWPPHPKIDRGIVTFWQMGGRSFGNNSSNQILENPFSDQARVLMGGKGHYWSPDRLKTDWDPSVNAPNEKETILPAPDSRLFYHRDLHEQLASGDIGRVVAWLPQTNILETGVDSLTAVPIWKARTLFNQGQWQDYFIMADLKNEILMYHAKTDTWFGPLSFEKNHGGTVVSSDGRMYFGTWPGSASLLTLHCDDVLRVARDAGLVHTSEQVRQKIRDNARKNGPVAEARVALLSGDFDKAESDVEAILKKTPDDAEAIYLQYLLTSKKSGINLKNSWISI